MNESTSFSVPRGHRLKVEPWLRPPVVRTGPDRFHFYVFCECGAWRVGEPVEAVGIGQFDAWESHVAEANLGTPSGDGSLLRTSTAPDLSARTLRDRALADEQAGLSDEPLTAIADAICEVASAVRWQAGELHDPENRDREVGVDGLKIRFDNFVANNAKNAGKLYRRDGELDGQDGTQNRLEGPQGRVDKLEARLDQVARSINNREKTESTWAT